MAYNLLYVPRFDMVVGVGVPSLSLHREVDLHAELLDPGGDGVAGHHGADPGGGTGEDEIARNEGMDPANLAHECRHREEHVADRAPLLEDVIHLKP